MKASLSGDLHVLSVKKVLKDTFYLNLKKYTFLLNFLNDFVDFCRCLTFLYGAYLHAF